MSKAKAKAKTVHIRRKASKDADLYCGGGRCNDQTQLASVGPQQADKGTCRRCIKNRKAEEAESSSSEAE